MHAHAEFPACISRLRDGNCGDGALKLCFVVFLGSATRRVAEAVSVSCSWMCARNSCRDQEWRYGLGDIAKMVRSLRTRAHPFVWERRSTLNLERVDSFFPNDCLPGSASQAHSSHDHDPYPISFPHSPIPQYFRRPSILGTVRV